jgi:hypothetical protein
MAGNVSAVRKTSSAAIVAQRGRVHGFQYVASGTAGTITFKNGGSGGTTLLEVATPASATASDVVALPCDGVLFESDIYLTIANVTSVTVFYTT